MSAFTAACPGCGRIYQLLTLMAKQAKQATLVCPDCGCAFDITPRPLTGLRYPKVIRR